MHNYYRKFTVTSNIVTTVQTGTNTELERTLQKLQIIIILTIINQITKLKITFQE